MLSAITSWAANTLIGRTVLRGLSPIAATTYAALRGLPFLDIGSAFEIGSVRWSKQGWQIWASIFCLGALGTVVRFIWYYEGAKAIEPSRTAVFNNLVPALGVTLAALLLGEPILVSMVSGGELPTLGVCITNRASNKLRQPAQAVLRKRPAGWHQARSSMHASRASERQSFAVVNREPYYGKV